MSFLKSKKKYVLRDSIIFKLQNNGGISRYWTALNFSEHTIDDLQILSLENISGSISILDFTNFIKLRISQYLPIFVCSKHPIVFHSSYYRVVFPNKTVRSVVTVHDCTYEKFSYGIKKFIHVVQKYLSLKFSDYIIYVSENTRRDIEYYYPFTKAKLSKVVYHGVSEIFCVKDIDKYDPFVKSLAQDVSPVVFIGTRSGYKNFNFAVEALSKLSEKTLWIVGGGRLSKKELGCLRSNNIQFRHFPILIDYNLSKLYNLASFLFYPSYYEGFGLPVIEAYCCGCPVIALNASAIGELHTDNRLLMKEITIAEFLRVHDVLLDNKISKSIIDNNQHFAKTFTWDKSSALHLEVYKSLT